MVPVARTVVIPAVSAAILDQVLEWRAAKSPEDVLDYAIDYSKWQADDGGVIGSVLINQPSGLQLVGSPTYDPTKAVVTFRIKGGIIGQTYGVQAVAFLQSGEELVRSIALAVIQIGVAANSVSSTNPATSYAGAVAIGGVALMIAGSPVVIAGNDNLLAIGSQAVIIGGRPVFVE